MRRSSRTAAATLTEFVSLLAREAQHRRRARPRVSQTVLAAQVLDDLETMPDLGPALAQLRLMATDRALDAPVKAPRKRPGRVIMLDQPA